MRLFLLHIVILVVKVVLLWWNTTIKENTNVSSVSNKKDPIVYIYNTHNKEQYNYDKNAPYNIIPTVLNTSYMLKEFLSKNNIESIVEERDISKILKEKKKLHFNLK